MTPTQLCTCVRGPAAGLMPLLLPALQRCSIGHGAGICACEAESERECEAEGEAESDAERVGCL